MGIVLFEVAHAVGDGTFWHMSVADGGGQKVGGDYAIADGQITAEGEFDHIVDQEEVETMAGSLNASCS